jgi:hypothetical protein
MRGFAVIIHKIGFSGVKIASERSLRVGAPGAISRLRVSHYLLLFASKILCVYARFLLYIFL